MSTIKATTLSNLAGSKTVSTDTVVDGSAKAWVNFNGTGTVAIRRAFNVSSITDNGVGDYTVNFSNAMVDGNYSVGQGIVTNTGGGTQMGYTTGNTYSTSGFRFFTIQGDNKANSDPAIVNLQFFS